ncbi:(d)CMP kinase [Syntrophothermus lipocalidus]|uniref:Cytidylate kinase n=1 Tax=Syntrophothermus lipocalidus (strain DSM 12680 / TGB-C1) TaxID=643648 RepID=D7CNG4_SYNLT|nr:(d)CMP kinase [Syntrophothermus lipocalidus]ADI02249.1 cytidylate kinase [Syntrophothermus lipocalidus DSM 12680]HOV42739.1 (d)CMP kinase [Syntrophothermus lipocalidus]
MKIAIDGPAGAGKSTLARRIAERLGILYVDTGAMYRALTWKALANKVNLKDKAELRNLAVRTDITLAYNMGQVRVFCDGTEVTDEIRSPEVSRWVPVVAADEEIRAIMVEKQQAIAREQSVVMDGRDIGLCVLPDADYKFYLTASLEERARRRAKELVKKGYKVNFQEVKEEIRERDKLDTERLVGPLTVLPDSIVIDTSDMSPDEVVSRVLSLIGEDGNVIQVS